MSSVIDASAILALLQEEPGAAQVAEVIEGGAIISAVNLSEVVARLSSGLTESQVRDRLEPLVLDVREFDEAVAWQTGLLRERTRHLGLSFGDRACLALAASLGLPAVTADRAWAQLDIGVRIELCR